MTAQARRLAHPRFILALVFLLFQLYLLYEPLQQEITVPVHIGLSLLAIFAWVPAGERPWHRVVDWLLLGASAAVLGYYLAELPRLYRRGSGSA